MTRAQIKEILDRVLTCPPERQADLAEVARIMEAQDKSGLTLTDEQAAEVRRRLAESEPEPKPLSLAEFHEHLRRRYAYEGRSPRIGDCRPGWHSRLDRQGQSVSRGGHGCANS